jgi:hypothetical protein
MILLETAALEPNPSIWRQEYPPDAILHSPCLGTRGTLFELTNNREANSNISRAQRVSDRLTSPGTLFIQDAGLSAVSHLNEA